MADLADPLLSWRNRRDRHTHTREIIEHKEAPVAALALLRVAAELDDARARIERLESVIAALAREAQAS